MIFKNKWIQLGLAISLGIFIFFLPRPEGTKFKISGDKDRRLIEHVSGHFKLISHEKKNSVYLLEAKNPGREKATAEFLKKTAAEKGLSSIEVDYVAWEGGDAGWSTLSAYHTTIRRITGVDTDTVADWEDSTTTGDPGSGDYDVVVPEFPIIGITLLFLISISSLFTYIIFKRK